MAYLKLKISVSIFSINAEFIPYYERFCYEI